MVYLCVQNMIDFHFYLMTLISFKLQGVVKLLTKISCHGLNCCVILMNENLLKKKLALFLFVDFSLCSILASCK